MKSKIKTPEILKDLKEKSYKSLLEKDLVNLKEEKKLQNFFVITEHKFACGNIGPLLIVGLTPAWKAFLKEQITTSNKNFGTGECKLQLDGKGLALGLERGKVKPSAVEKSFKKNVVLKKLTPTFSILEACIDDAAGEDESSAVIFATIKQQLAAYKSAKPNEKLNKLKLLKLSIDEWQLEFDGKDNQSDDEYKIAGSLAKLEAQLDAEVLILNKVDASQNAIVKDGNTALFDEIRQEFAEVKSIDIKSEFHTKVHLEQALKEINDVVGLVLEWNQNNPFNPKEDATISTQRKQIDVLHFNMQKYLDFVKNRIATDDYASPATQKSADDIKKIAGYPKDDKKFEELLTAYENIRTYIHTEMKEFQRVIKSGEKTLAHVFYTKIKKVQELAQKWMLSSQKATYILPASKKVAQQKEFAVQNMILSLNETLEIAAKGLGIDISEESKEIVNSAFESSYKNAKNNVEVRAMFFKTLAEDSSFSPNTELLLKNPNIVAAFFEYLKSEFNEQPFEFYLAVTKHKEHLNPTKAKILYENYILANSPKELNINAKARQDCADCLVRYNNSWAQIVASTIWQESIEKVMKVVRTDLKGEGWNRMLITRLPNSETLQELFLGLK